MALFTWHATSVPTAMPVTQVYGFIFAANGRFLLHTDREKTSLPGGKPEQGETWEETLIRETFEEVTCTITDPTYLGYQSVQDGNNAALYAQVRMIARLDAILPATPDPATGHLAQRTLMRPAEAATALNWEGSGYRQIEEATILAAQRWNIPTHMSQ